jgi:hypothetical protein
VLPAKSRHRDNDPGKLAGAVQIETALGEQPRRERHAQAAALPCSTKPASTSTHSTGSLDVNADADASTANVRAAGEIERGDAISLVETPGPVTTPGRASRARHPLSLQNIYHWRPHPAPEAVPEKIWKNTEEALLPGAGNRLAF